MFSAVAEHLFYVCYLMTLGQKNMLPEKNIVGKIVTQSACGKLLAMHS